MRPEQVAFHRRVECDGRRVVEAVLVEPLELPAGSVLRLVMLGGAVAAVLVVERPANSTLSGAAVRAAACSFPGDAPAASSGVSSPTQTFQNEDDDSEP